MPAGQQQNLLKEFGPLFFQICCKVSCLHYHEKAHKWGSKWSLHWLDKNDAFWVSLLVIHDVNLFFSIKLPAFGNGAYLGYYWYNGQYFLFSSFWHWCGAVCITFVLGLFQKLSSGGVGCRHFFPVGEGVSLTCLRGGGWGVTCPVGQGVFDP